MVVWEAFNPGSKDSRYVTFYLITPKDEHIPDPELYPPIPQNVTLTITPAELDNVSAYIKRPDLSSHESFKGTNIVPKSVLDETLIMEKISKTPPPPHIIRYHGCRVHRGRITGIVLERLDKTLTQYIGEPEFAQLVKVKFMDALDSAVTYLHGLGLAHNDLNPHNIMVKDGMPGLIDFGSCARFGGRLQSLGSPGWYEELFYTAEARHDTYALNKMREWLDKPE